MNICIAPPLQPAGTLFRGFSPIENWKLKIEKWGAANSIVEQPRPEGIIIADG